MDKSVKAGLIVLVAMFVGAGFLYAVLGGGSQMVDDFRFLSQGQAAVRSKFHYSRSAKFQGLHVFRGAETSKTLCGRVREPNNGANDGGFARLVSQGTADTSWLEGQTPDFEEIWARDCSK